MAIDPRFNESFPVANPTLFADPDCHREAFVRPKSKRAINRIEDIHSGLRLFELAFDVLLPESYTRLFSKDIHSQALDSYLRTGKNASIAMGKDAITIWPEPNDLVRANKWVREGDWEGIFGNDEDDWPSHLIAIGDNNHGDYFVIEAGVEDDNPPVLIVSHDPPCLMMIARDIPTFIEHQRSAAAICVYNALMTRPSLERAALLIGLTGEQP